MSLRRRLLVTGLAAVGMFAAAAPARAVTITEFPIEPGSPPGTHFPRYIHVGPDGALWYTQSGTASGIGRIATDGSSEPPIGVSDGPVDLVTLSDGTVFWTADGGWGDHSPAGGGDDVQRPGEAGYAVALDASGQVVWTHLGPDGSAICRLVATLTEGCNPITSLSRLTGLALDPNGRLWVAAPEANHLYRLNADATAADLQVDPPVGSNPARIALGPDGNLWVTMAGASAIDRVTPTGVRQRFALPAAGLQPNDIILGPDGALWFTEFAGNAIGRMTVDGTVTNQFPIPTPNSQPIGLTTGPDGAIWFTESASGKIGRLQLDAPGQGGGGGGGGGGSGPVDRVAPRFVHGAAFSVKRFRVGSANTPVSARSMPTGSTLSYTLSEPASVTIRIARKAAGRRVHGSCRAPSSKNRGGRHCTRYVTVATLTRAGTQGPNFVPFSGRIRHTALRPGAYRAGVTAKDVAGNVSQTSSATFVIVR